MWAGFGIWSWDLLAGWCGGQPKFQMRFMNLLTKRVCGFLCEANPAISGLSWGQSYRYYQGWLESWNWYPQPCHMHVQSWKWFAMLSQLCDDKFTPHTSHPLEMETTFQHACLFSSRAWQHYTIYLWLAPDRGGSSFLKCQHSSLIFFPPRATQTLML